VQCRIGAYWCRVRVRADLGNGQPAKQLNVEHPAQPFLRPPPRGARWESGCRSTLVRSNLTMAGVRNPLCRNVRSPLCLNFNGDVDLHSSALDTTE